MGLDEFLESARNRYIGRYRESIRSYRLRFQPSAPEVLLERQGDQPLVYRLHRMDLASGAVSPPDFTEVNLATCPEFEALIFERAGVTLCMETIVWNGVRFHAEPALASDAALRSWGLRWIDPEECAEPDLWGLGGYVHSITMPENRGGATIFTVDFGSAPVSSLLELLAALGRSGVARVGAQSRWMLDPP